MSEKGEGDKKYKLIQNGHKNVSYTISKPWTIHLKLINIVCQWQLKNEYII